MRRWLRRRNPPWRFPQGAHWRRFEVGLALLVAVLTFGTGSWRPGPPPPAATSAP